MRERLCLGQLSPDQGARSLPPTVIPTAQGVLVVEALPLSVRFSFRSVEDGPDLHMLELSNAQYELLVVNVDTAILAGRLGVLRSPAAVQ